MTRMLCIGEVMAEIRFNGRDPEFSYGGDTFNTAIYAARALGGGVGYLTRIGVDPLSNGLLDMARHEGLPDSGFIRDTSHKIGI